MSTSSHSDPSGIVIKCEECGKAYKIHMEKLPAGVSSFPCRACGTLVPIPRVQGDKTSTDPQGKVLIVVEEEELGRLIQRILSREGFDGHQANTGKEAIKAFREGVWDLLLISVYMPDMMGYELLDALSENGEGLTVPSILLSAIHHAARYKRAPTSLYGADDYLERHHLPDLLIPKIRRLLSPSTSPEEVTPSAVPPPTDEQVLARRDIETLEKRGQRADDPRMGQIQRMCRVIAGDIALYNEDVIANTAPEDLLNAIASDLREGEALLLSRFPDMEEQVDHLLRGEMLRLFNARGVQIS